MLRFLVETPAVDAVPRRVRIRRFRRPAARLAFPFGQFGKRGSREKFFPWRFLFRKEFLPVALDEAGVELAGGERATRRDALEELDVGGRPGDFDLRKGVTQACQRLAAILAVHDQLGDHRVVPRRDFCSGLDAGIHAHYRSFGRKGKMNQFAGGGQEVALGVFGIEARFDGMAGNGQLFLFQWYFLSKGNSQLPFHQVEPGDHLRHRVLHLQARVHFHEVEAPTERPCAIPFRLRDEFHGAGAGIVDGARCGDRGRSHCFSLARIQAGRRGFLQHLLVAPLHRAVAFEEVHQVALAVAKHLDLDVARPLEVALDQHPVVAEGGLRLPFGTLQLGGESLFLENHLHALAAAASGRLDQHRVADARRFLLEKGRVLLLAVVARHQRHAGLFHQSLGRRLVAHRGDCFGRGSDKDDSGLAAGRGEIGVLGQETVTRMDRLRARLACRREDGVDVEVVLDAPRLVGAPHMQRIAVGVRMDRHRADPQPPRGAHHAAGDLAAVGDQDFFEHQAALRFSRKDAMPSLPSGETRISAMRFAVSATRASSTGLPETERINALISRWACGPPERR